MLVTVRRRHVTSPSSVQHKSYTMGPIRPSLKGFVRLETATVLMAIVTVLAALGSLFPQLSPTASSDLSGADSWRAAVRARYGGWADLLLLLGVFRFSLSPLFLVPAGLLIVASVACILNRWSGVWRRIRWTMADPAHGRLGSAPLVGEAHAASGQSAQLVRLAHCLRRQHFVVQHELVHDDVLLRAHRNRWAGASTLVTHLAVVLLLAGALLSTFLASEQLLQIPYGETIAVDQDQHIALRNDGLSIQRHADGSPALFEAQLTVLDGERTTDRATLAIFLSCWAAS
jgi:cytochrome c biogenesis protein